MPDDAKWYVIHTYSGYENKVAKTIEKTVENRQLHDSFFDIIIPVEKVREIKDSGDGKKTEIEVERKLFPGYVLVKMVMNDESWHVVRNVRGVTSFVGPGSKPVPLSEEEILRFGVEQRKVVKLDFAVGDNVRISSGMLKGSLGKIEAISHESETVTLSVLMFGREQTVEMDWTEIDTDR